MRRAVPLLSGFAILAVIFNHANWHVLEHFAPGDPAGLIYLIFDQIGKCAIAAFLTVAGYYISFGRKLIINIATPDSNRWFLSFHIFYTNSTGDGCYYMNRFRMTFFF